MKLIIQIPCYNEGDSLPITLADLPQEIEGIDCIEVLVIDDGSTDNTIEVAKAFGVEHIVHHHHNRGLAIAFKTGLKTSLAEGADILVNTDADNQYPGRYIPELVGPILQGEVDIVIADRQTDQIPHFSRSKKMLQKLGSAVIRFVSGTRIADAPSGFRSYSREAMLQLNILTDYTYTLETVIQAGKKKLTVGSIPIVTNAPMRESRLIKNSFMYVLRSAVSIIFLTLLYEPLKTFSWLSIFPFILGSFLWGRYLFLLSIGEAARGSHIQSIVVGSVLLITGFLVLMLGLLGHILSINRYLNEELLYYAKKTALPQKHSTQGPFPG